MKNCPSRNKSYRGVCMTNDDLEVSRAYETLYDLFCEEEKTRLEEWPVPCDIGAGRPQ